MQSWEAIAEYLEEQREIKISERKTLSLVQMVSSILLFLLKVFFFAAILEIVIRALAFNTISWSLSFTTCALITFVIFAALFYLHTRLYPSEGPYMHQTSESPLAILGSVVRALSFAVPILLRSGLHKWKTVSNYREADFESSARVLDYLKDLDRGLPAEELKEELPFLDIDGLLPDLLLVEGFLFIHDTDRLSLTDSFKVKLREL